MTTNPKVRSLQIGLNVLFVIGFVVVAPGIYAVSSLYSKPDEIGDGSMDNGSMDDGSSDAVDALPLPPPPPDGNPPTGASGQNGSGFVIAIVTAITSLLGFVSNTMLLWRREQRDADAAAIKRERERYELEKLKAELKQGGDSGEGDK